MVAGALGGGGRSTRRNGKAPLRTRQPASHGGGAGLVPGARRDPVAARPDPRAHALRLGRCRRHRRASGRRRHARIRHRPVSICRAARRRPLHPGPDAGRSERTSAGASCALSGAGMNAPVSPWQTALQMFATRYAERVAVASRTRTLTYAQLAAQADAVRAAVIGAGVRPGEPVAILACNGPGVVVAGYGVMASGAAEFV